MTKYVVDASVVLEWITSASDKHSSVNLVRKNLIDKKIKLVVPEFLLIEVANVLYWKKVYSPSEVKGFVYWLSEAGIVFVNIKPEEITGVVNITYKHAITAYDALYIYLAKKQKCKLLTMDKKLLEIKNITISPDECRKENSINL